MEMKQISETTLKITISMEDLEERGMELKDFLIPQEKTEEFFYSVMDELELPDNFKNSGMLSFRVTPRKDRLDVFVTKSELENDLNLEDFADMDDIANMSPEDFFKTLEQTMRDKSDSIAQDRLEEAEKAETILEEEEESFSDYVHYVLAFDRLEDALTFSKAVDFDIEASELYKWSDRYYMTILLNVQDKPNFHANVMYARMLEFAKESDKTRAYLQEHGVQLLYTDAAEQLKLVKVD
ncbi:adaptor protein MecA [Streptococcus loxodontisalivarius]|uniref:Adapter protein MecA n=1 Tax=Streptococcus loxodontisalivarius TaxID=1349415 RepID=A0ABS2PT98_9STRE|nr:adaptor protein MecA [Streptococcus loxodontisalivarius]MBM7643244.1 adapter protein MecA 1/2 [Streptococcus loxodontisalivarius]